MAISNLTAEAVLSAIAEFDGLGRDIFLEKYGFAPSRRYWIRYNGKLYDSKAIAGVAHGYLPGERRLAASAFSGGADHAAGVLGRLGFEVMNEPEGSRVTTHEVVLKINDLRPALLAGRPMLKQAVVLLWAIGCAHAGDPRLRKWSETVASLTPLLETHRREGERREGRPDYPIAALFRAGLWDMPDHPDVPPAHGDAALKAWFAGHAPRGGLPQLVYALVRESAQARIQIIEAVCARFFDDIDDAELLSAVGLYDDRLAEDVSPDSGRPRDAKAEYARWCELAECRERRTYGRRRTHVTSDPIRLAAARRAVLLRSGGRCENPACACLAPDLTDSGEPILEVDHVEQLADGGRDHPTQMIALCPNCHAVKTRGQRRHRLAPMLRDASRMLHEQWTNGIG